MDEVDIQGGRQAHFMIEEQAAGLRRFLDLPSRHAALLPAFDAARFTRPAGLGSIAGPRAAARIAPPARRRAGAITRAPRVAVVGGSPAATWDWSADAGVTLDPVGAPPNHALEAIRREAKEITRFVQGQMPGTGAPPGF